MRVKKFISCILVLMCIVIVCCSCRKKTYCDLCWQEKYCKYYSADDAYYCDHCRETLDELEKLDDEYDFWN